MSLILAYFLIVNRFLQDFLSDLTAMHSLIQLFPQARFAHTPENFTQWRQAQIDCPPVVHPIIHTHLVTGKKLIFVNEGFTIKINELSDNQSKAVLNLLFAHIAKPEFTVRWHWQVNDIAFWDNRATQHYTTNDYGNNVHRVMHRATINGDKPFYHLN